MGLSFIAMLPKSKNKTFIEIMNNEDKISGMRFDTTVSDDGSKTNWTLDRDPHKEPETAAGVIKSKKDSR